MTTEAATPQKSPYLEAVAYDNRLWIGVIATLLLAEIWMHVFGHQAATLWGLVQAGVVVGVGTIALRHYRRVKHTAWIIVAAALAIVGLSVAAEALDLHMLGEVDLTFLVDPGGITTRLLGRIGPSHGLLAVGHLTADLSVIGIGVYQLVRWRRLRDARAGVSGIAALAACCGTTAVVLAPVFGAILGTFGIHRGEIPYLLVGTLLSVALVAIAFAYAWTGRQRRSRA